MFPQTLIIFITDILCIGPRRICGTGNGAPNSLIIFVIEILKMDLNGSAAQAMAHPRDASVSIPMELSFPAADMHFL
jgi:hypothetical protein